ncbi:putative O-methyltransferase [Sporormia fimetaria CBS 119925]|uniref:catechol O-methyltransferase n=1 Tax=Sporormia fimetaria CBS 119925 TaxID=1340428 RepID=A0A6A6VGG0_9PLEO|nr:putative O-methyltransferase [Sporormia fimetaria CBS 119925]
MTKQSEFDPSKAYAPQESDRFFDDGREIQLLHYIYSHPELEDIRGSPERVIATIDEYARTRKYLMNVGELKGRIVTNLIAEVRPRVMVELGGYVGYSCILFGDALRRAGGQRYYSLEMNPEFAAIIASLVDLAGLSDIVKVIVGRSDMSIRRLQDNGQLTHIDLLFLDHFKPAYVTDLKLCESLGLIAEGSVIAADNVIKPGNPAYLQYVRATVAEKQRRLEDAKDAQPRNELPQHIVEQYGRKRDDVKTQESNGNPRLVYQSKLVQSFEPTGVPDGVEITRCLGE